MAGKNERLQMNMKGPDREANKEDKRKISSGLGRQN